MIELVRDLRVINVLAKFENDPWTIMDVRVLTGHVCPAARPLGVRQYPGALKGCGVKTKNLPNSTVFISADGCKFYYVNTRVNKTALLSHVQHQRNYNTTGKQTVRQAGH